MSIKIQGCGEFPLSINCTCYNQTGEQEHDMRQYNSEFQTYKCCNDISTNPINLRVKANGCCFGITSPAEYLEYIDSLDFPGGCDYSRYINGDTLQLKNSNLKSEHESLYYSAVSNMSIYNNYICKQINPGTGTGTCFPVPVFDSENKSVSCTAPAGDTNTYVPQQIEYFTGLTAGTLRSNPYSYNVVVCIPQNDPPKLVSYEGKNVSYFITKLIRPNGIQCTDRSCPLPYEIGNVQNLGNNEPNFQSVKPSNDNTYLGVGIALLILGLIAFGFLGYYIFIEDVRGKKYEFDAKGNKRIRQQFVSNRLNNKIQPVIGKK